MGSPLFTSSFEVILHCESSFYGLGLSGKGALHSNPFSSGLAAAVSSMRHIYCLNTESQPPIHFAWCVDVKNLRVCFILSAHECCPYRINTVSQKTTQLFLFGAVLKSVCVEKVKECPVSCVQGFCWSCLDKEAVAISRLMQGCWCVCGGCRVVGEACCQMAWFSARPVSSFTHFPTLPLNIKRNCV